MCWRSDIPASYSDSIKEYLYMEFTSFIDSKVHLKCVPPDGMDIEQLITELRNQIKDLNVYSADFCSDHQLLLFLTARDYDISNAYTMIVDALKWRDFRKPDEYMLTPNWKSEIYTETETGKLYIPGACLRDE